MQDFLAIADHSPAEIQSLLELAAKLKKEHQGGGNKPILKGKSLAMVFQKPSLRTLVSFEMGMEHLGGHAIYIGPQEIGLGQRESIADVARVLEGYVMGSWRAYSPISIFWNWLNGLKRRSSMDSATTTIPARGWRTRLLSMNTTRP